MTLSLDFLREFMESLLSEKLRKELPQKAENQARQDLMDLHASLAAIEEQTALFVASIGDLAGFDKEKFANEGQDILRAARKQSSELLTLLLNLAEIMDRVAPKLSVYQYELIREIQEYRSSRALIISKLEEEIYKIEYGDYTGTIIHELYLRSLENLTRITQASAGIRQFIATQFGFKELYE